MSPSHRPPLWCTPMQGDRHLQRMPSSHSLVQPASVEHRKKGGRAWATPRRRTVAGQRAGHRHGHGQAQPPESKRERSGAGGNALGFDEGHRSGLVLSQRSVRSAIGSHPTVGRERWLLAARGPQ
jgi:hypothetical protein